MTDDIRRTDADDMEPDTTAGSDEDPQIIEIEGLPGDAPPPAADEEPAAATPQDREDRAPGSAAEASLRERVSSLEEDLLRVRADFENFRKRQVRERAESSRMAAAELVTELLPVLDNFRRALEAEPGEGAVAESYSQGVRMIHDQLADVLRRAGLEPIETEGRTFDPNVHEAVARHETTDVEPNTITAEVEPGYLFRDRLLKPARVCVAAAPSS